MYESLWSKQKSRGVYPSPFGAVKWIIAERVNGRRYSNCGTAVAAGWACLCVLAAGCTAPQAQIASTPPFTPIGASYAVACETDLSDVLASSIDTDFENMARAGMNTVFVKHSRPDQWFDVMDSAARHNLNVIITDPEAVRFVRSGTGGDAPFSEDAALKRSVVAGRTIGTIVDDVTLRRARKLTARAHAASPPMATCVHIASDEAFDLSPFDYAVFPDASGAGESARVSKSPACSVCTVTCRKHRRDEETTVRSWLAAFHMNLARGCAGGVLFDTYRSLPGQWDGIVFGVEPPTPERITMLRRIADRANRWCPLLAGLSASEWPDARTVSSELYAARLSGGKRRYLLLVNTSPTHFIRKAIEVPAALGGSAVERAVTVATDEDTTVGDVFHNRQGVLRITIELPPGEARLYELF